MAVYQIVFSPTGGTENCAYIVATTLNSNAETIDLTDRAVDFTKVVIAPEDICVIAVPSFGGRVPAVALERLAQIKGNGAKAILMAVYGNREIDDTLLELKEVAEKRLSAIREFTFMHKITHFRETLCKSLFFHIIQSKFLDTWRVDDITAESQRKHLRECCCMFSFFVDIRYIAHSHVQIWIQSVDESRLTHARMT